ncbi:hypothetical protein GCM10018952_69970 [Streptosporangium vulgare]
MTADPRHEPADPRHKPSPPVPISYCVLGAGGRNQPVSRLRLVDDHRDTFGVKRLCRVLKASRSGFYRWIEAASANVGFSRCEAC